MALFGIVAAIFLVRQQRVFGKVSVCFDVGLCRGQVDQITKFNAQLQIAARVDIRGSSRPAGAVADGCYTFPSGAERRTKPVVNDPHAWIQVSVDKAFSRSRKGRADRGSFHHTLSVDKAQR